MQNKKHGSRKATVLFDIDRFTIQNKGHKVKSSFSVCSITIKVRLDTRKISSANGFYTHTENFVKVLKIFFHREDTKNAKFLTDITRKVFFSNFGSTLTLRPLPKGEGT